MNAAERHRRLADIITAQDELAAVFLRLDAQVRDLARAEFCEPDFSSLDAALAEAPALSNPAKGSTHG